MSLPTSATFFNLLNNKFQFEESSISNLIKKRETSIHFCVDGWTDRSNVHFLGKSLILVIGVTGTFILSGEIKTVGLGFARCQADGESMAKEFIKVYERFNIQQNTLFITSDNCIYSITFRCI